MMSKNPEYADKFQWPEYIENLCLSKKNFFYHVLLGFEIPSES